MTRDLFGNRRWVPVLLALAAGSGSAQNSPTFDPHAVAFFESRVQPILKTNCLPCHNRGNRSSGLAFDTREEVLRGGARGPAVKPGAPGESRLIEAVEQKGDLKMPLGRERLNGEQIAAIRQWIEQGAPWTAESGAGKPRGRDHWAFQPPGRPAVPAVKNSAWVRNPIDNLSPLAWNART